MSKLAFRITVLSLFLALGIVAVSVAESRVLTGELVALDGSADRFRIVGHDGSYRAPGGISTAALDGKAVRVELGSDGRVLQITETPIAIQPVAHSTETINGQLIVGDAVTRTFTLAGDTRVYIAPMSMDIRPFGGRRVDFRLDDSGQVSDLRLVTAAVGSAPAVDSCTYDGQTYSNGGVLCQTGTQHRCENGIWRSLGQTCVISGDTAAAANRPQRSCLLGGATLSNGSFICRDGQTMRCADGSWISAGKACS